MGKAPKVLNFGTSTTMREILEALDSRFQVVNMPEFGKLVNYSQQTDEAIHRWFRYREGYSTKLIETLIQDIQPKNLIVDPFCGAGTTLLAARNLGYPSVGIDANPISTLVARTKTRNYSNEQVRRFEEVCSLIRQLSPMDKAIDKPKLEIIDKVFLPEVLHTLLIIRYFIEHHLVRIDHDFFFVAWLAILEKVSNVFKEGNGIKYRNRKRTPTGYINIPIDLWQASIFPEGKFEYVIDAFLHQLEIMISDVKANNREVPEPEVFEGDALTLEEFVLESSASLVVFSPPYVNNFNYFKAYKIELWMGGFITNYDDLKELTHKSLRSHVETRLSRENDAQNWYPEELDALINLIDGDTLWTPRIPQAIKGYFYDMHKVLENIYTALEPGGQCVIVVGNSAYGSVLIPTDALLAETATYEGFNVEKIAVARHLTTSSQQKSALEAFKGYLRESLVFLRKPISIRQGTTFQNGTIRYRHVEELPKFPRESSSAVYVIKNQGLTDLTHIIHKYPGRFIPHVPRWAIEKYGEKGKIVLDPFCGSGTSLVEARLAGHFAYGIDIDPLARLISKVKTTPIYVHRLVNAVKQVTQEINAQSDSCFRPAIDTLYHWFSPIVSNDLGVIREVIEQWKETDKDIYDFLVVCMSSIIRKVSLADNQSLKTYVSGTHSKTPISVKPAFLKVLHEYAERVIQFGEVTVMVEGGTAILDFDDARSFANQWLDHNLPPVDIGITSPPYIKTIDYVYNQMAEYFWIGDLFDLENQVKQNRAKRKYIGTEKVATSEYKQKKPLALGIQDIDDMMGRIEERSIKHAYIFYRYFEDMKDHLKQMYQILNSKGKYVVVVGDSAISDIQVPTHELLARLAETEGFRLESQFVYEIRNRYMRFPRQGHGGLVDLDWILTFQKLDS